MKICYLCADLGISLGGHNGASTHIRSLIQTWTHLGHEVLVLTPAANAQVEMGTEVASIPRPEIFDILLAQAQEEVEISSGRAQWNHLRLVRALGHLWNNVALENALQNVLTRFRPDFIYERYSPFCIAGVLMAKRLGIPHILNVNAPLAWEGTKYRQQALPEVAEALERRAVTSASLIVTTCQELKEDMLALGVPPSKVAVAPMGVDVNLFTPQGPAFGDKRDGKITVGFVGSLKSWHGIEVLADVFKELAEDSRFCLMVVGDGPMMKVLHPLKVQFPDRVQLAGNVPQAEVPPYVRAMDITVAPYPRLERFYFSPLKVLEYMAAGRAVVASRMGQLAELIDDGKTGILTEPGDVKSMVQAIRNLSLDEELRQSLGANACAKIRQCHTWMHRAQFILELAQKICAGQPASSVL